MKCKNCGSVESDDSSFCSKCKALIFDADVYFERYIKGGDEQGGKVKNSKLEGGVRNPGNSWVEIPAERERRLKGVASGSNKERGAMLSEKQKISPNLQLNKSPKEDFLREKLKGIKSLQKGRVEFDFDSIASREIEINKSTSVAVRKANTESPVVRCGSGKNPSGSMVENTEPPKSSQPIKPKAGDGSDISGGVGFVICVVSALFCFWVGSRSGVSRIDILQITLGVLFVVFLFFSRSEDRWVARISGAFFRACKFSLVLLLVVGGLRSCSGGGYGKGGDDYECEYSVYGTPTACTLK